MLRVAADARVGGFALAVTLAAGPGVTAIRGPSACGKSLALRLIAGLVRCRTGTVEFDGACWDDGAARYVPPEARGIGYAPQHGALWPHWTVREHVARFDRAQGLATVADLLEIGALLDRTPAGLSGGERQRVALARALAGRPRLLLLDEPWSALDATARRVIAARVCAHARAIGATTVLVTHDSDDVASLADRVVAATEGRIGDEQSGTLA